jgi:hypothetical protein
MQMQQMFDARNVEPSVGFIAVPTADYTVRAVKSEPTPTNDGTGGMLVFELEILDGPYAGQKIMYRLNLWNTKSQQAVSIAWGQLSALCHVTGVFQLQQTEQLHGIPFKVHVVNDGTYANVKYVMDLNGNQPGKRPAPTATAPAAMPAAAPAAAPAWPPPAAQTPVAAAPPWGPPQPAQATLPTGQPQQPWGPPAAQPAAAAPPAWTPPGAQAPLAQAAPAPTPAQPPWMTQAPAAAGPPAAPSWKP